jgi:hypothetical protein
VLEDSLDFFENPNVPVFSKRSYSSTGDTQTGVRDDTFPGDFLRYTETVASRAGSVRGIE